MTKEIMQRLQAKTREQRLLNTLEQEFQYAPKIAQAIVAEAQECLLGQPGQLRAGQMRQVLLKRDARHGQSLGQTATTEVTWTIDGGVEDQVVAAEHGHQALRGVRIQRLLDEAVAQGAVASQEDLARALQVSVRTIKRDCAQLRAQGVYLPTRGNLQGIGRGQTHKAQIVGLWMEGATYDQIAQQSRHSLSSVQRYLQSFFRVVGLREEGFSQTEIALLLQMSRPLVEDYLAVHHQHQSPRCQRRLNEQLQRLRRAKPAGKKGVV